MTYTCLEPKETRNQNTNVVSDGAYCDFGLKQTMTATSYKIIDTKQTQWSIKINHAPLVALHIA